MYSILRDCCFVFLCCMCVSVSGLRDITTGRKVQILIPRFAMYSMQRAGCAAMECALTYVFSTVTSLYSPCCLASSSCAPHLRLDQSIKPTVMHHIAPCYVRVCYTHSTISVSNRGLFH